MVGKEGEGERVGEEGGEGREGLARGTYLRRTKPGDAARGRNLGEVVLQKKTEGKKQERREKKSRESRRGRREGRSGGREEQREESKHRNRCKNARPRVE